MNNPFPEYRASAYYRRLEGGPNQMIQLHISRFGNDTTAPGAPMTFTYTVNRTFLTREKADEWFMTRLLIRIQYDLRHYMFPFFRGLPERPNQTTLNRLIRGMFIIMERDNDNSSMNLFSNLTEINANMFTSMFERIRQYDTNANIFQMRIKISFREDVYDIGGDASLITKDVISKAVDITKITYQDHMYQNQKINCAAFALNYGMYYQTRQYRRPDRQERMLKNAYDLQQQLNWGDQVSTLQLEYFVKVYPTKQIVLIVEYSNTAQRFIGKDYDIKEPYSKEPYKNTIFLAYYTQARHFVWVHRPDRFIRNMRNSNAHKWCDFCCTTFKADTGHLCDEGMNVPEKKRSKNCKNCGETNVSSCKCSFSSCPICKIAIKKKIKNHRCINYLNPYKEPEIAATIMDGKKTAIWGYDVESMIIRDNFLDPEPDPDIEDSVSFEIKGVQDANYIYCENIHTGESKEFIGAGSVKEFLEFAITVNCGNNIFFAHNGKGYDTRLLFEQVLNGEMKCKVDMILRGSKFLQLKVNNCIFRDSSLHMPGSLKSLGKELCKGLLSKGFFPHLFNTVNNWRYVGPIPHKLFFETDYMCKNDQDLQEFEEFYESWQGRNDWCFRDELIKYCINDVKVLNFILLEYEKIFLKIFKDSPLFSVTAPAYVHKMILKHLSEGLELGDPKDEEIFWEKFCNLDKQKIWVTLESDEYNFVKNALMGGRTEVHKLLFELIDEQIARGEKIIYIDVCSLYPFVQILFDYPTGVPTINVWNKRYRPCIFHKSIKGNYNLLGNCNCRENNFNPKLDIVMREDELTREEILSEDFFGFIAARVRAPRGLRHPVLLYMDEKLGKRIAPAYEFSGTWSSVEFQLAVNLGYEIFEIYRYDKYTKTESKWTELLKRMYLMKLINSEGKPTPERLEYLITRYEEKHGMGDMIREVADDFQFNPAMKMVSKIFINCAWGKHCQRPNMPETLFYDNHDNSDLFNFFDNQSKNLYNINNVRLFDNDKFMINYTKDQYHARLDIHNSYLPAGVMVAAFGRLMLVEEMLKLGDRVIMNDTDSIIYHYKPDEYAVPTGGVLGDWEEEKISKRGICGFVGPAPKTYGIKCIDGYTKIKAKGLSLSLATNGLLSYEKMTNMIKNFMENDTIDTIHLPQKIFSYRYGKGIRVEKGLKVLQFDPNGLKGELKNGCVYPLGYFDP